jgi:hypothetical protein
MNSFSFRTVEDIFSVFGPFSSDVRDIGYAVLFVFLTVALIREMLFSIQDRSNYAALFVRVVLIAGLFSIYTPFFREVTHGMDMLARFFMPDEDFKTNIEKVFTAFKQNKDLGMIAVLKMTFLEWTIQGSYNLAYTVMRGFAWIRLIFLSALYISGPIFLGVGVFLPNMAQAWVRWLFEVSSWNVVLSLFVRILTEMNFFEMYQMAQTPALDLIAMNIVVILIILFFVPLFSSMMIRGAGGLSGAGGAILGLGSALTIKQVGKGIRTVGDRFQHRSRPKQNSFSKENSQ